ncbi:hypothetical protein JAAARDRAFT_189945 [Jaapia argillacea MUCL 33604]|uniref:Uncharacterized protein n=1 Tax=Jaapia argillacea MUCL 33604 TaxID=933084 RepID=A0A067Q8Y9_9AGAM|nr:hypothetical protein JAAARDRAFT_189945 [Jaapia argillacea MUCL 33604]
MSRVVHDRPHLRPITKFSLLISPSPAPEKTHTSLVLSPPFDPFTIGEELAQPLRPQPGLASLAFAQLTNKYLLNIHPPPLMSHQFRGYHQSGQKALVAPNLQPTAKSKGKQHATILLSMKTTTRMRTVRKRKYQYLGIIREVSKSYIVYFVEVTILTHMLGVHIQSLGQAKLKLKPPPPIVYEDEDDKDDEEEQSPVAKSKLKQPPPIIYEDKDDEEEEVPVAKSKLKQPPPIVYEDEDDEEEEVPAAKPKPKSKRLAAVDKELDVPPISKGQAQVEQEAHSCGQGVKLATYKSSYSATVKCKVKKKSAPVEAEVAVVAPPIAKLGRGKCCPVDKEELTVAEKPMIKRPTPVNEDNEKENLQDRLSKKTKVAPQLDEDKQNSHPNTTKSQTRKPPIPILIPSSPIAQAPQKAGPSPTNTQAPAKQNISELVSRSPLLSAASPPPRRLSHRAPPKEKPTQVPPLPPLTSPKPPQTKTIPPCNASAGPSNRPSTPSPKDPVPPPEDPMPPPEDPSPPPENPAPPQDSAPLPLIRFSPCCHS